MDKLLIKLGWLANISVHAGSDNGVDIARTDDGILYTTAQAADILSHFSSHILSVRMSWRSSIGSMNSPSAQTTVGKGWELTE